MYKKKEGNVKKKEKRNVWLTPREEWTFVLEALGEIEESRCLLTRPIKIITQLIINVDT